MKNKGDLVFHENGFFAVVNESGTYAVKINATAAITESAFEQSSDGLSLAICRCDYLARRNPTLLDAHKLQQNLLRSEKRKWEKQAIG